MDDVELIVGEARNHLHGKALDLFKYIRAVSAATFSICRAKDRLFMLKRGEQIDSTYLAIDQSTRDRVFSKRGIKRRYVLMCYRR
jgi:hypothetical protein